MNEETKNPKHIRRKFSDEFKDQVLLRAFFDILYNVTSEIDVQWLSGNGHSINQVNFILLDFIDKQFAPHFKRINHK